jgi:3-isopropylmalate/(R)-2-methylmalate dehydratase small subunit
VGRNFGCGSSREHAPWALADAGFQAIIALSVADIFRANAIKNGIVPVVVERAFHDQLRASAGAEVTIDIDNLTVTIGDKSATASFSLDPFARHCLMSGVDELGLLLGKLDAIVAYEKNAESLS